MRLYRLFVPILAVAALSGCSSIDNAEVDLIPPELAIRQMGGPGPAANQITGGVSVNLKVQVFNPGGETIKLKRLEFMTIGQGAYTVANASRPFDKTIEPGQTIELETWVAANSEGTIIGTNGPVTMRVTAYFDSDVGQFRKIYTINMNTDLNPLPKPQ